MAVAARFDGFCGGCRQRYAAGTEIEKKGNGKWGHVTCPAGNTGSRPAPRASSARRSSAPRRPVFPWDAPPSPGAHLVSRRAQRGEGYAVGQVVHAPKVQVPGGGPDGHYYTVLAETWTPANEDNGQFDSQAHAWVRAATDEEAAPLAARAAAKADRAAKAARLEELVRSPAASLPEAEARAVPAGEVGPKVELEHGYTYSVHGEVARCFHPGHYDDYRASAWQVPATQEIRELIAALAARQ